jgi:hypothetical protein
MLHTQVIVDVLQKLDVRAGRSSWRHIQPHLQRYRRLLRRCYFAYAGFFSTPPVVIRAPSFEIEYRTEALTVRGALRCYSVSSAWLPFQLIHDGIVKLEKRRSDVLLKVLNLGCSGNGEHHPRLLEKPRERHLCRLRIQPRRRTPQRAA